MAVIPRTATHPKSTAWRVDSQGEATAALNWNRRGQQVPEEAFLR